MVASNQTMTHAFSILLGVFFAPNAQTIAMHQNQPLVVLLQKHRTHQSRYGRIVGENPHDTGAAFDLSVEPLKRIGAVQLLQGAAKIITIQRKRFINSNFSKMGRCIADALEAHSSTAEGLRNPQLSLRQALQCVAQPRRAIWKNTLSYSVNVCSTIKRLNSQLLSPPQCSPTKKEKLMAMLSH